MSDRIWIQFAENGNIRKWQSEPFDGGTEYVVAYLADAELEEMTRSCLAERAARLASPQPANPAQVTDAMVRAAYEDWIADVRDLEPTWSDLPDSYKDSLRGAIAAAIGADNTKPSLLDRERAAMDVTQRRAIEAERIASAVTAQVTEIRARIEEEHAKVSGDDGYNYAAGHEYGLRQALIIIDAAIGAGGQAVADDEPTVEMSAAGMRVIKNTQVDHFHKYAGGIANSVYDAMRKAAPLSQPHPADERVVEALPNWAGWRSIDTALEDCRVILATAGNWVGEAIMLRDEDTGEQVWTWVDTGKRVRHSCYGWMPLPEHIDAPVLSDLRPDGSDGPTGAE